MKNRIYAILAVMVTAVMFSSVAYAQVVISQARVTRDGIPALASCGDTLGFPATICRPGSYKLTSNLNVPPDVSGIEIVADNVTIDLNGFVVAPIGSTTAGGITVLPSATAKGTVVRNGTVRNFSRGISVGEQSVVEQTRVINNSNNGISAGKNSTIRWNNASRNTGIGIFAAGDVFSRATGNSIISENTVSDNGGTGILFLGISSTISGNTASGNGGAGIFAANQPALDPGAYAAISRNSVSFNDNVGISVVCPANIVENTALLNGPDGLQNIVETPNPVSVNCTRALNNPAP